MSQCFIIQPFDRGTFDKRYDDIYAPAVVAAGLEPYRVDRDVSVSIPIDQIEDGIRGSAICLAEITTDNPNVWFELGFAIAVPKEVILVCSDERKSPFPFDVQHRAIILYSTESSQDFELLGEKITGRIKGLLQKERRIGVAAQRSPIKETEGLLQHEMVALVTIMENGFLSSGTASGWKISQDMNNVGFTDIAVSLGIRMLLSKEMIFEDSVSDRDGDAFQVYGVTEQGAAWLVNNQDKLKLRHDRSSKAEDDLPF